ncbi:MAG: isocitrate/isopropylmalate family dehydrogenase [Chloroflexi bacterium]|nr:isocitrate/isopropylmalate family dehydrogenase [Chloroflexota bacterium]
MQNVAPNAAIERAKDHFGELLERQIERVAAMKESADFVDYDALDTIKIGLIGGDGIGPAITDTARGVLERLLSDAVASGKIEFRDIEGLTIENRAEHLQSIPDAVLSEIKECDVTLKGPTTTPEKGDGWPNLESANVGMRKELDLFANVRPVRVPSEGIDWMFFRENTEDLYALGSDGIDVTEDFTIDFRLISEPGSERIIRAAFEHAKQNGRDRVTVVTKANIVKLSDGRFLQVAERIGKEYPGIEWDGWYIDIMTAKLLDTARRSDFQVFVMPNLYGDILTDEAAEIQGGVGTAGAANIGTRYAMFEAIHGSAPRMVTEGRAQYADPSSMLKASAMLLQHIGYADLGRRLDMALEVCGQYERKIVTTGRDTGATGDEYGAYVADTVNDPNLESKWQSYVDAS